jgi:acid stress-induced BolA-like protein IbaG/YrbA
VRLQKKEIKDKIKENEIHAIVIIAVPSDPRNFLKKLATKLLTS